MTRASLHLCFVGLTMLLLGTVAQAGPQQKVSVLGLEAIVGANGQIDPADTQFAKDLSRELRSRVNNSKNYTLTKDTRELVDEKLMSSCGSEDPACMGPIGKAVGADVVLYGNVKNARGGSYVVTLTLVDVKRRAKINTDTGTVPAADTKNPGLGNWVREHYRKLTNENSDGTLVVVAAGAGDGRVLVGNDTKEKLRSGRAEITLPEGRYKVGVEADGFRLWEQEGVTISAGERTELKPDLLKSKPIDPTVTPKDPDEGTTGTQDLISREGTVSAKRSNKLPWKIVAGVGLGGAAVFGGVWAYQWTKINKYESNTPSTTFTLNNGMPKTSTGGAVSVGADDCDKGNFPEGSDDRSRFNAACKAHDRTAWLIPTTVGLAVVGAGALIYVMVSKDDSEQRPTTAGRQKKHRNLVVTPVVTQDGTGATLRFDW